MLNRKMTSSGATNNEKRNGPSDEPCGTPVSDAIVELFAIAMCDIDLTLRMDQRSNVSRPTKYFRYDGSGNICPIFTVDKIFAIKMCNDKGLDNGLRF